MSQDQAVLNRIWSKVILEELARFGVTEVCVAPGSRSTPLTLEADANAKLNLHTHYDERGLGFLALGLAKASSKPVAVIVTSGTAVANLLPAIAEAKLTGEKLIVLTADRPVELVGCGANQAIVQHDIFSSHVTKAVHLPSPDVGISLNWLLTTIDDACYQQQQAGSAIHINCPFPEPLYSNGDDSQYRDYLATIGEWSQSEQIYCQRHLSISKVSFISNDILSNKGVVIVGSVSLKEALAAKQFAQKLGWPLLCDPQSGINSQWAHFDLWLQNATAKTQLNQCEQIIQFGSRIVSKRLNQWLSEQVSQRNCRYGYVYPNSDRNNPAHLPQQHWVADISDWVASAIKQWTALTPLQSGWADSLIAYSTAISQLAKLHLSQQHLTEIAVALELSDGDTDAALFLGNSLIVRLADMFSVIEQRDVYSNRGASGIDGLVATAAGVHRAIDKPMLMILGDTSLLYDLNSLALVRASKHPLVIVVCNNDGGAIFDLLPVPAEKREALYQMPHGMNFKAAAEQFGLHYAQPETLQAYHSLVQEHLQSGEGCLLVEVIAPPQQASEQIKQLTAQIHAL
ncbi:2-succinyl-5-enolpyruvyl-6-hydroxy-3-cyclohexene-1-carboxylic-acid synthase [Vibrio diazotrophicus]|uniref:2-succinyl-5-enolpyruvyl-6-hydroxy-3-cyclohexene-1-carboxylate synthase n=1 Tax=Vibrio diazotrophicus TaxID=685 RepID=A0A2J8I0H8_VIBDI|nr:2-succinyl-5-enolpyruvyl-6-hydroxy-3-cyclohexene-1-carboxylic-acid synthase [Vibrio diazotrophicus]PNI04008.1 2-succinyl-5-enolpyruvyl-6-hydroxy-3-cyclohexene-1-carboxylic-acid synthase [Vibrio diazotrophicus]